MAVNSNNELKNKHCLYMAQSESGKSVAIDEATKKAKRGIFWDPDQDYKCDQRFTSKAEFARYLVANGGNKNLSAALSLNEITPKSFDFFCQCVWLVLDGKKETHVIMEELSDVSTAAVLPNFAGQIIRKGRKYGAVVHAATQRPQDISKTVFTQCKRKWVGYQDSYDHEYLAKNIGVDVEEIAGIKPLEFIMKDVNDVKKAKFTFSKNIVSVVDVSL